MRLSGAGDKGTKHKPSRYLPLGDRVIAHTGNAGLLTAGTAREFLIATVLAQAAAVTSAHVAEIAALANLAGGTGASAIGREVAVAG